MMDAVKRLTIMGAQSHENTVLNFNRYGVHRISAEGSSNSHGKSVIMKMIDVLAGENLDAESRRAIIRDGSDFALVSLESYNGYRLSAVVTLEKSDCFYMLHYKGQEIKKSLSDDYKELIKVLNFHKIDDFDYSLNRYKTKTTLPFTHFTGTQNEKILVSASEIEGYRRKLSILDELISTIDSDLNLNKIRVSGIESNLNDIKYKYSRDDIVNFNIFDNYVQSYDYTKELYLVIKDINDTRDKLNYLRNNKPTDVSFLSGTLVNIKKLNESIQYLSKAMEIKNKAKKMSETIKPVINLNSALNLLQKIDELNGLLITILDIKKLINTKKCNKPIINLDSINNLNLVSESIKNRLETQQKIESQRKQKPIIKLDILSQLASLTESTTSVFNLMCESKEKNIKHVPLDLSALGKLNNYLIIVNECSKIKEKTLNITKEKPIIDLTLYKSINDLYIRVQSSFTYIQLLEKSKVQSKVMLEDLRSLTEKVGHCPTCGGKLDLERILEHEH